MLPILLAIPGKLQTLLTRLSATRANNLDLLDATVSSRAPAATALSTAVWTPAHADAIIAGGGLNKALEFITPGAFTFNVPIGVTCVFVTVQAPGGCGGRVGGGSGGGGGGGGECFRRMPYPVVSGGTVSGNVGAGVVIATSQNSTFGTLTAQGGKGDPTASQGRAGGGLLGGGGGQTSGPVIPGVGGVFAEVIGGSGGGAWSQAGASCGRFAGGAGYANGGGGGASYFAPGGAATVGQPVQPGIGAGAGGTSNSGATLTPGGNGYVLVEWVGS